MFDRSILPSGPKASSSLNIDKSRLPSSPPYTVYLGNLSFECSEDDIVKFFERKKLVVSQLQLQIISGFYNNTTCKWLKMFENCVFNWPF